MQVQVNSETFIFSPATQLLLFIQENCCYRLYLDFDIILERLYLDFDIILERLYLDFDIILEVDFKSNLISQN